MLRTPWLTGGAQRQGRREVQADAFSLGGDLSNGRITVAVADGIGDTPQAARVAELAADTAATVALESTPEAGCLAARHRVVNADLAGDASLVTVLLDPAHSRIQIAWAGLCRVYLLTSSDELRRATYDHSLGEHVRRCTGGRSRMPQYDRKITRSVTRREFVTASLPVHDIDAVLLCTDGVSWSVPEATIAAALRHDDPIAGAELIACAAGSDGPDNATAIVLRHKVR
jgi:protein phosphatase